MSANEILRKHGPAGWLIRRLQQVAILGWVLFFILLGMIFIYSIARTLAPQPVVAVDEAGNVLGILEYLAPSSRSDQELKAASMRFAHNYLSLNSDTVYEDYSEALNMMAPDLMNESIEGVKKDDYLARIKLAKTRSWLEFRQDDGVVINDRRDLNAQVRLRGNIVVDAVGGNISKPFDMTLEVQAVARSTNNTSGLKILSRRDN